MNRMKITLLAVLVLSAVAGSGHAQCPARPNVGSVVNNPLDLYSTNGVLTAAFTFRSELAGYLEECYI